MLTVLTVQGDQSAACIADWVVSGEAATPITNQSDDCLAFAYCDDVLDCAGVCGGDPAIEVSGV